MYKPIEPNRTAPQRLFKWVRWALVVCATLCVQYFMLATAWDVGYMNGYNDSAQNTHRALKSELLQNCQHWFTDKRRQHKPGAVILCKTPDWMKDDK